MSYDIMVFDAAAAPKGRDSFMQWYRAQTEWTESHGYSDPDIPTPPLQAWFRDIIASFPPLNGPLASDAVDDPKLTDYCLGRVCIYAAFAWSQAELARARVLELAASHGVGVFEASSPTGEIWCPDGPDRLAKSA